MGSLTRLLKMTLARSSCRKCRHAMRADKWAWVPSLPFGIGLHAATYRHRLWWPESRLTSSPESPACVVNIRTATRNNLTDTVACMTQRSHSRWMLATLRIVEFLNFGVVERTIVLFLSQKTIFRFSIFFACIVVAVVVAGAFEVPHQSC